MSEHRLSSGLTLMLAAGCGAAVANLYYNQPMLAVMAQDFAGSPRIGLMPTATQLGYALGLFLLVPLGDIFERRKLIIGQFLLLALLLVGHALAPTPETLLASAFCVGMASSVAQQIVPMAAALAEPEKRGKVIGTVMAGLLCGLLFSRTLSGFVASHWGWREMFWLVVPLALAMAGAMALVLPKGLTPSSKISYAEVMLSLAPIWRGERLLRLATLSQALLFATFTSFWAILAFHLREPHLDLGADVAGAFGLVAVVGVLAAPLAGRLADKRGPGAVIQLGLLLAVLCWGLFAAWDGLAGMVVAVILLDFAMQSVLVSNQHRVYVLRPEARSRINTLFMSGMFLGGALGSGGATLVWHQAGWLGVCGYCALLAGLAFAVNLGSRKAAD